MNGKLEIKRNREDFYRLQINDTDDYIEFDLTDIGLPEKILNASDNIFKIDSDYQKKIKEIDENCTDEVENLKQKLKLEKDKCIEMRKEFDSFLGAGSCQKIFGDANYYGMFLQLFEALEPHFEKMEIKLKKGKEKLANKYLNNTKDVL
ncbi:MAG: hypothetical protein PUJ51_22255 [Clostridiales bacterium]|uniref:DUF6673 family protein n=1 Tax=Terrisporobacter sp. TaxID=1965305 RepID=UPI002A57BF34|nr:DUF6673 family protein [Terrisporobacter sp.]MDD7757179.1 hypothetical protein [Clostridiales bacterium]MDY4137695.1 DUF6673 family protein [Terrisporobacter sp.]